MQVDVGNNKHGLPVVSWVEPYRQYKSILFFHWTIFPKYRACCLIDIDDSTGEPLFVLRHERLHKKWWGKTRSKTPLSNLASFSLHSLHELCGNGELPLPQMSRYPDIEQYRDLLVLVADLKQPASPDLPPVFPLTATTASRVELMALHAKLTDTFLLNPNALKSALTARQEKQNQVTAEKKGKRWIKPPVISGGRKFVKLWNPWKFKPEGTSVVRGDDGSQTGYIQDTRENNARAVRYWHYFERQRGGATERWMARCVLWIHAPSDPQHPKLIQFVRSTLDKTTGAFKPRELFKAVRLFNGSELQLPQDYFSAPDVRINASTLILCLEFSDGELLPLTYAPASERESVETLYKQMEYVFAGEGNGGPTIVL